MSKIPARCNSSNSSNTGCVLPVTSTAIDDKNDNRNTEEAAAAARVMVDRVLTRAGISSHGDDDVMYSSTTTTKAGWCLRRGLIHLATHDAGLAERIARHGVPRFYACCRDRDRDDEQQRGPRGPDTAFESLCRIIVGQFVSGRSARAAWQRVLALAGDDEEGTTLTPERVMERHQRQNGTTDDDVVVDELRSALGVTRNKARAVYDLARHFRDGRLSEDFLSQTPSSSHDVDEDDATTSAIRRALLNVRGIGPWSCDMFLLFTLERSNVLPLGDLGVRKGLARHFFPSSSSSRPLCPKKDRTRIHERLRVFAPYHSLLSYYMWRVADTPDAILGSEDTAETAAAAAATTAPPQTDAATTTSLPPSTVPSSPAGAAETTSQVGTPPPKKRARRSPRRVVTP